MADSLGAGLLDYQGEIKVLLEARKPHQVMNMAEKPQLLRAEVGALSYLRA